MSRMSQTTVNPTDVQMSVSRFEEYMIENWTDPMLNVFNTVQQKSSKQSLTDNEANLSKQSQDLRRIQRYLSQIPRWNTQQIQETVSQILQQTKKSFKYKDILRIIFVNNTALLVAGRPQFYQKNDIFVTVPTAEAFLHRALTFAAKSFFEQPSLLMRVKGETEDNRAEKALWKRNIIRDALKRTIHDMLPTDKIAEMYFNAEAEEEPEEEPEEEEEEDDEEPEEEEEDILDQSAWQDPYAEEDENHSPNSEEEENDDTESKDEEEESQSKTAAVPSYVQDNIAPVPLVSNSAPSVLNNSASMNSQGVPASLAAALPPVAPPRTLPAPTAAPAPAPVATPVQAPTYQPSMSYAPAANQPPPAASMSRKARFKRRSMPKLPQ
eukprot:TRINITY_DN4881_c0_g1_i1.p4 TRINITY_DN4881_c0_g1~~TRINITY_DN4881_c0_g1_i1.p4  ORF type:complete len:381 (-),score=94.19 TRINITY_DN4881_c0_g1_i1:2004-3146(-)